MTTDLSSSRHDRSAGEEDWEWVEWTCAASTQVSGGGEWCAGSVVLPDVSKLRASDRQATCGQSRGQRGQPCTLAFVCRGGGARCHAGQQGRWTTVRARGMVGGLASVNGSPKKVRRIGSIGAPDAHLEVTSMSGRWVPATRKALAFNAGIFPYCTAFCANLFIIGAGIVKSYMPRNALSARRMLCAQQTEQQRHAG